MKKIVFFSLIMALSMELCWAAGLADRNDKPVVSSVPVTRMPKMTVVKPTANKTPVNETGNVVDRMIAFGKGKIPADYRNITILGETVVTREKALAYVLRTANNPLLNCTLPELVDAYYDEATKEGVRPDLALCQAILETGMFSFRGTVHPKQNNFCGLGTTGKGVRGCEFATAQEGVRAHIQHLLAYCRKEEPRSKVVDPRYDLVHRIRMSKGLITRWFGLNGTWAMSPNYSEKIMAIYNGMMNEVGK